MTPAGSLADSIACCNPIAASRNKRGRSPYSVGEAYAEPEKQWSLFNDLLYYSICALDQKDWFPTVPTRSWLGIQPMQEVATRYPVFRQGEPGTHCSVEASDPHLRTQGLHRNGKNRAMQKTCRSGHTFEKSTDCSVCPTCERSRGWLARSPRSELRPHGHSRMQRYGTWRNWPPGQSVICSTFMGWVRRPLESFVSTLPQWDSASSPEVHRSPRYGVQATGFTWLAWESRCR